MKPYGVEAVSAAELNLAEPEETGSTFRDNAALKAEAAARGSEIVALADDFGLCVAALRRAGDLFGALGGRGQDFCAAMARVERELKALGAPPPWRASFVSVLPRLAGGRARDVRGAGRWRARLPAARDGRVRLPSGFRPDGHDRTFGEMGPEEKHGIPADGSLALSHRARAFQKLSRERL